MIGKCIHEKTLPYFFEKLQFNYFIIVNKVLILLGYLDNEISPLMTNQSGSKREKPPKYFHKINKAKFSRGDCKEIGSDLELIIEAFLIVFFYILVRIC